MMPTMDADLPKDGRKRRACLEALGEPATVEDVARRLGWSHGAAKSWVYVLVRAGLVHRVGETRISTGHLAGRFQRVSV